MSSEFFILNCSCINRFNLRNYPTYCFLCAKRRCVCVHVCVFVCVWMRVCVFVILWQKQTREWERDRKYSNPRRSKEFFPSTTLLSLLLRPTNEFYIDQTFFHTHMLTHTHAHINTHTHTTHTPSSSHSLFQFQFLIFFLLCLTLANKRDSNFIKSVSLFFPHIFAYERERAFYLTEFLSFFHSLMSDHSWKPKQTKRKRKILKWEIIVLSLNDHPRCRYFASKQNKQSCLYNNNNCFWVFLYTDNFIDFFHPSFHLEKDFPFLRNWIFFLCFTTNYTSQFFLPFWIDEIEKTGRETNVQHCLLSLPLSHKC